MSVLLWILQGVVALLCVSGGGFKLANPADLTKQFRSVSAGLWRVVGLIEVVGGVLLILPGATGWMPVLTPIAAGVLALENLALAAFYGRSSTKMVAANPFLWAVLIMVLAAVVAIGRFALAPLA